MQCVKLLNQFTILLTEYLNGQLRSVYVYVWESEREWVLCIQVVLCRVDSPQLMIVCSAHPSTLALIWLWFGCWQLSQELKVVAVTRNHIITICDLSCQLSQKVIEKTAGSQVSGMSLPHIHILSQCLHTLPSFSYCLYILPKLYCSISHSCILITPFWHSPQLSIHFCTPRLASLAPPHALPHLAAITYCLLSCLGASWYFHLLASLPTDLREASRKLPGI